MPRSQEELEHVYELIRIELKRAEDHGQLPVAVSLFQADGCQAGNMAWFGPAQASGPEANIETLREDETTGTEDTILQVLREADQPLKANTIARRGKCDFTNHFRSKVYGLFRKNRIIRTEGNRYWLAERQLPTEFRTEQQ